MSVLKPAKKRRLRLCENCLLEDFIKEIPFRKSKYGTIRLCEPCLELPITEIKISDTLDDVSWCKLHKTAFLTHD